MISLHYTPSLFCGMTVKFSLNRRFMKLQMQSFRLGKIKLLLTFLAFQLQLWRNLCVPVRREDGCKRDTKRAGTGQGIAFPNVSLGITSISKTCTGTALWWYWPGTVSGLILFKFYNSSIPNLEIKFLKHALFAFFCILGHPRMVLNLLWVRWLTMIGNSLIVAICAYDCISW